MSEPASSIRAAPPTYEELRTLVGTELGVSHWSLIDQRRIDQFAECTGDRQWIHVDRELARRRSPVRTTIAHGYLTLALIGTFFQEMNIVPDNTHAAINYGMDRMRFLAPVKAGSRVRMRMLLTAIDDDGPGKYLMRATNTIEIEGETQPALVADCIVMLYERRERRPSKARAEASA